MLLLSSESSLSSTLSVLSSRSSSLYAPFCLVLCCMYLCVFTSVLSQSATDRQMDRRGRVDIHVSLRPSAPALIPPDHPPPVVSHRVSPLPQVQVAGQHKVDLAGDKQRFQLGRQVPGCPRNLGLRNGACGQRAGRDRSFLNQPAAGMPWRTIIVWRRTVSRRFSCHGSLLYSGRCSMTTIQVVDAAAQESQAGRH